MKYTTQSKHISTIRAGDTVKHDGQLRTVCNNDLNRVDILGITLFGDSYHAGYKLVDKVVTLNGMVA